MIAAIVILLMVAALAAGYVMGKDVGFIKRDAQVAEDKRRETIDAYEQLIADYKQIEYQLEVEQKEKQRAVPKSSDGWEAIDIRGRG